MTLTETAKKIRRKIITESHRAKSPHVGSCLSCVDILTTLYFHTMKLDPWENRDIFILSKGHAALALYSTLTQRGIIEQETIGGFYTKTLPGHLDRFSCKGVEVSAGSLGHGFNVGLGIAWAFKRAENDRKVYVVVGDGECQEGSIWEGAAFASNLGLDNFTVIVDRNNLQGYAVPNLITQDLACKFEAFGWNEFGVDGHDCHEIADVLNAPHCHKPTAIIADTIKGKGVSFMEDQMRWHYYMVNDEHKKLALEELS